MDIFEFTFLINLMLFDSQRRLESCIDRLNSEDFLKFFLCLDILFPTYIYESTRREMQKNAKIFSNILECL